MHEKPLVILASLLLVAIGFIFFRNWESLQVDSFEECAAAGYPVMESYPRQCRTPDGRHFVEEVSVGGQRDEHGCLVAAGYSYDPEVGACARSWELNVTQREAARIAMEHLGREYADTIVQVQTAGCPGCFVVEVSRGEDGKVRRKLTLENYTVALVSLTPEECEGLGGRTVTTTGGATCDEGEDNLGEVAGFISPAICCKGS